MFSKRIRILSLCVCMLMLMSACAKPVENTAPAPQSGAGQATTGVEPIKIGFIGSVTGQWQIYGEIGRNAAKMAVDHINAEGGLLGRPVELLVYDNQSEAVETTNAARKAILEDKVCAVIGPDSSSALLAMYPVCEENSVTSMAYASSSMEITQFADGSPRPWRFRVNLAAHQASGVMAKYALEKFGYKNIAALCSVADAASVDGIKYFEQALVEAGGTLVANEGYKPGDVDFRAQLSSIKNLGDKIDAIYIPAQYTELGLIANQLKELGINKPLIGDRGWMMEDVFKVAGNNLNGSYFNSDIDPMADYLADFVKEYDERHGAGSAYAAGTDAFFCYDSMLVLFNAIKVAGTDDRAAIRDAVEASTRDLEVLTGKITLDPDTHNCHRNVSIIEIKDQKFEQVEEFYLNFG